MESSHFLASLQVRQLQKSSPQLKHHRDRCSCSLLDISRRDIKISLFCVRFGFVAVVVVVVVGKRQTAKVGPKFCRQLEEEE